MLTRPLDKCGRCTRMCWSGQHRRQSIQNQRHWNCLRYGFWWPISGWQCGHVESGSESKFGPESCCTFSQLQEPEAERECVLTIYPQFSFINSAKITFGSSSKTGSSFVTHGRFGEPRGLYAVTTMSWLFKKSLNFCCVKYGWHSIWLVTGLMRQLSKMRLVWAALKFEMPMLFVKPKSTASSIAFHVSTKSASEKMIFPSSVFGKRSSPSLYANGQWIKYKSRYGIFKFSKVFFKAGMTISWRWYVFHNLLVMNRSSLQNGFKKYEKCVSKYCESGLDYRLTVPSLTFAWIPSPTSASLP